MIKRCIVCGETFESKRKKQKVCSKACAPRAKSAKKNQDGSIQSYEEMFNDFYKGKFRYVSGYVGMDNNITYECITCGHIRESGARCLYKAHEIKGCMECTKTETKKRNELKAIEVIKERQIAKVNRKALAIEKKEAKKLEKQLSRTRHLECSECGTKFISTHKNAKYCSEECVKKYTNRTNETRRRHKLRENGVVDYSINLYKLIKKHNSICALCNEVVDEEDYKMIGNVFIAYDMYPSIDHIMPVSKGGTHTWDNVQLAHRICNSKKSASYEDI